MLKEIIRSFNASLQETVLSPTFQENLRFYDEKELCLGTLHPQSTELMNQFHHAVLTSDDLFKVASEGTDSISGYETLRYANVPQKIDKFMGRNFPGNVMMQTGDHVWIQMQGPLHESFANPTSPRKIATKINRIPIEYDNKNVSIASVFSRIFSKLSQPIIVILGKPMEEIKGQIVEKYAPYILPYASFSNRDGNTHVEIATTRKETFSTPSCANYLNIHDANFCVINSDDTTRYINTTIFEFSGVADGGELQDQDVMTLAIIKLLADNLDKIDVVTHCSAGIGRSGTFTFATYLYKHYDEIFVEDENQTIKNIVQALNLLNSNEAGKPGRPGTVQNFEQLLCAIRIAKNIKLNEFLLNQFCVQTCFQDLIFSHATQSQIRYTIIAAKSQITNIAGNTTPLTNSDGILYESFSLPNSLRDSHSPGSSQDDNKTLSGSDNEHGSKLKMSI